MNNKKRMAIGGLAGNVFHAWAVVVLWQAGAPWLATLVALGALLRSVDCAVELLK